MCLRYPKQGRPECLCLHARGRSFDLGPYIIYRARRLKFYHDRNINIMLHK